METNRTLPNLVKDITLHYIKFYYDKYLKEHNITIVEDSELQKLVNELYTERQRDLRDYIRKTLKSHLKEGYSSLAVENILCEMFDDADYAKERVILEITNYQNKLKIKTQDVTN